jgi:integrating conjugative element protein (TIGR03746 family)
MSYEMELENERERSRWFFRGMIFLAFLLVISVIGNVTLPRFTEVYVPPDLRMGATIKPGEVPEPNIFAFAQLIHQQVKTWHRDGASDYINNINALTYYLTPDFKADLERDFQKRMTKRELSGRVRSNSLTSGMQYSDKRVKWIGNNRWVVYLDMHVIESIDSQPVRNVVIRYPIYVVKDDIDPVKNQWGLRLDGYQSRPRRLR